MIRGVLNRYEKLKPALTSVRTSQMCRSTDFSELSVKSSRVDLLNLPDHRRFFHNSNIMLAVNLVNPVDLIFESVYTEQWFR